MLEFYILSYTSGVTVALSTFYRLILCTILGRVSDGLEGWAAGRGVGLSGSHVELVLDG